MFRPTDSSFRTISRSAGSRSARGPLARRRVCLRLETLEGREQPSASSLVISQFYADGGSAGAIYNRDFIELFNPTTSSVDLSGLSLQYADTGSSTWSVSALSGTLDPGRYFLIGGASNGTAGDTLPTLDLSTTLSPASTGGKVALVTGTFPLFGQFPTGPSVVDVLGYGDAEAYEGSSAAPAGDAADAVIRLGNGNYDSNDNGLDFLTDTPVPRNSASPTANLAPTVTVQATTWTAADTPVNVTGISVADPDAGTAALQATVATDLGTLALASTTGLTFTTGTGSGDATMTFTGTQTAINAALSGLVYTPASGYHGGAAISVGVDDLGNTGAGGDLTDSGVETIAVGGQVVAVDDRDVTTNEDTAVTVTELTNDAWVGTGSRSSPFRRLRPTARRRSAATVRSLTCRVPSGAGRTRSPIRSTTERGPRARRR